MRTKRTPLIAFVGTTPNIGTTTAAFAAAMRLAEATDKPVGYLCLHLKSAKLYRFLGVDEPEMTLDKLQPELRSGAMTPGMLHRATYAAPCRPNLRILFGSVNREQAEYFTDRELEHLLDIAEQTFSVVVLDVGAYWDNAATVISMRRAATRVVVTTGALSHFQEDGRRWIGDVSPLFQVEPGQFECLIVRGPSDTGAYSAAQISRELGTPCIGELRLTPPLFASLDKGDLGQWLTEDKAGQAALATPAKRLIARYGLYAAEPLRVRSRFFRRILAKGGAGSA